MDFGWSEEQAELREAAREFASGLNQGLRERDAAHEFDREGWRKLAEFGIHGLPVPKEYGGMGADILTTVGVLEALGLGCRDNGLIFSINAHMWTTAIPIRDFGTEEQKQRYLPRLCAGELIGGNAMSEPGSGSDAYSLQTTAERKGDRYLLNGEKIFVSNGAVGDLMLVYATVDRAKGARGEIRILVDPDTPGVNITRDVATNGNHTTPQVELYCENYQVTIENRRGREDNG
jgi:alkylation response protein AidB-like acyl-CoA dehydrogenase